MVKKLLVGIVATTLLGAPILVQADSHIHNYTESVYVGTTQNGSYTHKYVAGYNPATNTIEYGTCTVSCEIERYAYKCKYCSATNGGYTISWDCHGECGQGDVKAN